MTSSKLLPRTTSNVISLLAEIAPPILDARLPSGHCVPGTRVGIDVLTHFGIQARACVTRVAAGDRVGLKVFDAQSRGRFPELKRVPRLKLCGLATHNPTLHAGEYDRHLVIIAENRTLVDLTAGFFGQPGAEMPSAVISLVDDAFLKGRSRLSVKASSSATIRYHSDPSNVSHFEFRSWQGLAVTRELTRMIIATIVPRLAPAHGCDAQEHRHCA